MTDVVCPFYTHHMAAVTASAPDELARLRVQLTRLERRRADIAVHPVHPALAAVLPGAGLNRGAVYSLPPSTSLVLALLAAASQAGAWCAVIGMPALGAEAAEGYGVALSRLVLIPEPGDRWMTVASTVAEVVPIVAVRPQAPARPADAARLTARLRDRGGVLLTIGPWPGAEAVLDLRDPVWSGAGDGHGLLEERTVTVTAAGRRSPFPRSARVRMPGPAGSLVAGARNGIADAAPALRRTAPPKLAAVNR